jgi:hypothetical protein
LEKHVPALQLAGLCNFHIRKINFREQVKNHPFCEEILQTFRSWLQEARVSTHEWEEVNFPKFCAKWPGIAAEYANTLYPSRTRWALAWAPVFLAGKTGNTTAEQGMNSAVSWFSENKWDAEAISILIYFDVECHRRLCFEKG